MALNLPQKPYLVYLTPIVRPHARLIEIVGNALEGGVSIVQLRDKEASKDEFFEVAEMLRQAVPWDSHDAKLVLNTYADIAIDARAHGVHLPELARGTQFLPNGGVSSGKH